MDSAPTSLSPAPISEASLKAPLTAPSAPSDPPTASPYSNEAGDGLPSAQELEQTLRRLMRRVAMMIQADKCVFLLHDAGRQSLVARPPALGLTLQQVKSLRLPVERGLSGRAFSTCEPVVLQDVTEADPSDAAWLKRLEVRNLIAYPLVLERRDEQERVVDRVTVGVLLVINKRGGDEFAREDLRLLAVMARQVTAVIADAQIYLRLSEEKEQLQATLQSLLSAVVMVESSGYISLLNPAARQMFGLKGDDGVGQHYEEIVPYPPIRDLLRAAVEDGEEGHSEIELPPLEGHYDPRIFQVQTALVHGEQEGAPVVIGVVAIFNDITEIRNVERMKTAFVSTVSHELRTPLTSIKGFISTLLQDKEGYFDDEMRREFYEIIDGECDRLRRLIEDLLNVSRIEAGRALQMNWTTFDPLVVIQRVLTAQRAYTDKHQLMLKTEDKIVPIVGDADKFDQIMTNLVSNAIKYSPRGGEITVEVGCDGETLRVAVRDQGMGIPPDKLTRIFDKFERVDNRDTREVGGTGIGLFLVKHLVERHEGHIHAESELGQGSAFIFEIPVEPESAATEQALLNEQSDRSFHLTAQQGLSE
jgi:two-component system phosphate regulon sensor histidine kinase PhoR